MGNRLKENFQNVIIKYVEIEWGDMMKEKMKEVLMAVLPIIVLVLLIHFFLAPLSGLQLGLFFTGALMVWLGLTIFLLGVDISISRMGYILGRGLTKQGKLSYLVLGGILIGFIVSVAEPSLTILGGQIQAMSQEALSQMTVVILVSIGVALMLAVGMLRIVFHWDITKLVAIGYGVVLILSLFVEESLFTFAFDASGATTGALTVPFVLAMSSGISTLSQQDQDGEDASFGLVGIASIGPILAMLVLGVINRTPLSGVFISEPPLPNSLVQVVKDEGIVALKQVVLGVLPLIAIFLTYHGFIEKQSKRTFKDIMVGLSYLMVGLVIFLTGVSAGFMPTSQYLGGQLFQSQPPYVIILIGFILGVMAILAEPAIYVLIDQIEDITGGTISRNLVLALISIGVGVAISLTIVRILVPGLRLWHLLLPGYLLIIILAKIIPNLFVGMGFDSGGVASGPMTGTFIFAYVQGISIINPTSDPIIDGFGMIALVAMVPILFIEILGCIYIMLQKRQED